MKKRILILGMILVMTTAGCGQSNVGSKDIRKDTVSKENGDSKEDSLKSTQKEDKADDKVVYKSADQITMDDLMNHDVTPVECFEYAEDSESGLAVINNYIGADPIVVIPDEINGNKVIRFDSSFMNNEDVVAVRIGNNVTEIKSGAFVNCRSLKYVVLGSSVEKLGGGNFVNTDIEEVVLNEGLLKIGSNDYDDYVLPPREGISIKIPESVTEIHITGFNLIVKSGSYAEEYAKSYAESNRLTYTVE